MPDDFSQSGLFAADHLSPDAQRKVEMTSSALSAAAFLLGMAGLVGWRFDIPFLRHWDPSLPDMRPVSALSLALLAGALRFGASRPRLGHLLTLATMLFSLGSLVEGLHGIDAFVRSMLVDHAILAAANPELLERAGPTPDAAAFGFLFISVVYLCARQERLVVAAQSLGVAAMFGALVPVLGHVYRIHSLSSPLMPSSPAFQSSIGIVMLAGGILLMHPRRGVIGVLSSDTAGSRAARRLLVPAIALPIVLGGVFIAARQLGTLDLDAAVPVFVSALAATLGGSVLWVARAGARQEILERRSEASLREAMDASPLIMWMSDSSGNGSHANPALLEFTGFTLDAVINEGWSGYTHPDDLAAVQAEIRAAYQAQRPFSAELRVRRHDGVWRWVLSTGMPRFTSKHEISGYSGSWVDVTARKDAESALQRFAGELESRVAERTAALTASKEELARQTGLLESIVKSMGDGVLAVSLGGEILLSNDAALRLFGASAADAHANATMPGFGFFLADGVTPFPTDQMPLIRALGGESIDNATMIARHQTAPEGIWVRITGRPLRDRDGHIIGSIVVGRDVTDFETALEGTRRLAAVVESSGDAILSLSLDGKITSWNRGAEQMYGYSAAEATGVALGRLDSSADRDGIEEMMERLQLGAPMIRRDATGRRRDGSTIDIAATISPVHDDAGRIRALSVVHHDVSHRKEAERRIQTLNDQLEQRVRDRTAALVAANHDLETYASSVAHDLRTPLRAIAGFARVLEEDYAALVGDEGRRVIGVVRKNAQDMGAFIDALLSFSAVDRQPPQKTAVDVAALVRECVDSLGQDVADRDVIFHVGDLPPCHADRASLKQVFLNLLANAVKFTRRSEQARIDVGSTTDANGATVYQVRDNGVGFDMSNTRRLFGLFQRLHSPSEFEGTGLGLANVARIVAAHGGRAWAEAEPGKGATFHFIIEQREEAA